MLRKLPQRPDLEFLKKQAKQLLRSVRNKDSASLDRVRAALPFLSADLNGFKLHDAQSVIAREFGFDSWPKLKSHIEALQLLSNDNVEIVDAFLKAVAKGRLTQAEAMLSHNSWLSGFSIHTAASLGDFDAVSEFLAQEPSLAVSKSEQGYPYSPLAYACLSPFGRNKERQSQFTDTARLLLQHDANPNDSFINDEYPDNPLSVLYAASGLNNNPELTRLLLETGANPNDNESLYHSAEHKDHQCMKLLFQFGVNRATAYDVAHSLDHDDLEGTRLILEHGADLDHPDMSVLHHAILRRRSLEHIALLLQYGADPGRTMHGMSVLQYATARGRSDIVSLLVEKGATGEITQADRFVGACCSGSYDDAKKLLEENPSLIASLSPLHLASFSEAVFERDDKAVQVMIDIGFPHSQHAQYMGTPLHAACWLGKAETVQALINAGANVNAVDPDHQSTPFGWVCHGSNNAFGVQGDPRNPGADYGRCAELLLAAGAAVPQDINASDDVVEAIERFASR